MCQKHTSTSRWLAALAAALLLILMGSLIVQAGPPGGVTNLAQVNRLLEAAAQRYGIPPVLLKAIAFQESRWDHYWQPGDYERGAFDGSVHLRYWGDRRDPTGYVKVRREPPGPSFPHGAFGIGMMQITIPANAQGQPQNPALYERLKNDVAYNIDQGAQHLMRHLWVDGEARRIIENWWYTTYRYNGYGSQAKAYSERVRNLVVRPPSRIAPYMEPLSWTLPWEVKSNYQAGRRNGPPTEFFLATASQTFIFGQGSRQTAIPAPVHHWTRPPASHYTLIRGSEGQGTIRVRPEPSPQGYLPGTDVVLMAHPAVGWDFSHWAGADGRRLDDQADHAERSLVLYDHTYVQAVFTKREYAGPVTTQISGRVQSEDQAPVNGLRALLFVRRGEISYSVTSTPVRSDGSFVFEPWELESSHHHHVGFRADTSQPALYTLPNIPLDIGPHTPARLELPAVNVEMGRGLHLLIRDPQGRPMADQWMQVWAGDGWGRHQTNSDGELFLVTGSLDYARVEITALAYPDYEPVQQDYVRLQPGTRTYVEIDFGERAGNRD